MPIREERTAILGSRDWHHACKTHSYLEFARSWCEGPNLVFLFTAKHQRAISTIVVIVVVVPIDIIVGTHVGIVDVAIVLVIVILVVVGLVIVVGIVVLFVSILVLLLLSVLRYVIVVVPRSGLFVECIADFFDVARLAGVERRPKADFGAEHELFASGILQEISSIGMAPRCPVIIVWNGALGVCVDVELQLGTGEGLSFHATHFGIQRNGRLCLFL